MLDQGGRPFRSMQVLYPTYLREAVQRIVVLALRWSNHG